MTARIEPSVLALVLLAALLHALWNALVKSSSDRIGVLGAISFGHVILGAVLATQVPVPAIASWPFIIASTIIHFGYYYMLNRGYRLGDLSQIYPIARGVAPVLVTLGAQFAVGEVLPPQAWAGILTVSAGILLLSSEAWRAKMPRSAVQAALLTGGIIAAYSLVDGLGVRHAAGTSAGGVTGALGYIAWLFIFEIFVASFIFRQRGRALFARPARVLLPGIAGGLISAAAYGMVIYAKTLSALGVVSSLRETSVLFAALIGVVVLGERPWRLRLVAAGVVLSGVLLITVSQ